MFGATIPTLCLHFSENMFNDSEEEDVKQRILKQVGSEIFVQISNNVVLLKMQQHLKKIFNSFAERIVKYRTRMGVDRRD
jgi:S-adenosylmethionine:tRNA-ribosyltransferase-isomerase (queuine synthetase)